MYKDSKIDLSANLDVRMFAMWSSLHVILFVRHNIVLSSKTTVKFTKINVEKPLEGWKKLGTKVAIKYHYLSYLTPLGKGPTAH